MSMGAAASCGPCPEVPAVSSGEGVSLLGSPVAVSAKEKSLVRVNHWQSKA